MEIRPLSSGDCGPLLAFYLSLSGEVSWFYRPFGDITREKLAAHLAEAGTGQTIALGLWEREERGGRLLGHAFISGVREERPTFGIGLHQTVLGRGWGRKLMSACLAEADRRELPLVTLTVLESNDRAIPLYESLGFRRTGQATFRADNDSVAMERHHP